MKVGRYKRLRKTKNLEKHKTYSKTKISLFAEYFIMYQIFYNPINPQSKCINLGSGEPHYSFENFRGFREVLKTNFYFVKTT